MDNVEKLEEKAKKVSNRTYKIPENSKQADNIQEAAEWINHAIEIHDQVVKQVIASGNASIATQLLDANRAIVNAGQWLEMTGVTKTTPPSIENVRK